MSAAESASTSIAAVVLVGGRARRMGGAVKHLLELGGSTPWDRTLAALAANGITPVVAVGPGPVAGGERTDAVAVHPVAWVREDPPFGGPVAALAAALSRPELDDAVEFLLLAGDLAHPEAVVARLVEADPAAVGTSLVAGRGSDPGEAAIRDPRGDARNGSGEGAVDGIVFRAGEHPQWLAGRYRTAAVRSALAAIAEPSGVAARELLGGLPTRWIPDEDGITADIDTPEDLERARTEVAAAVARSEESA